MYTLYYLPGAYSLAVHVALLEVGEKFDLVNVAVPDGQPRPAEFLKVNPRGNVPVLVKEGFVLREGAAILTMLLDEHKSPLLAQSGDARATALEWLAFANASLHPAYGRVFFMMKALGAGFKDNAMYMPSVKALQILWDDVEQRLGSSEYLAGEHVSVVDILVTVISNWTPLISQDITFGPKTTALFARVVARPTYQKAMEAENITRKVAA
ncbi:MAG: glutathione S-transferase family protein [Rickettsiales bacterium]